MLLCKTRLAFMEYIKNMSLMVYVIDYCIYALEVLAALFGFGDSYIICNSTMI